MVHVAEVRRNRLEPELGELPLKRLDVSLCGTPINIPTLFVRGESDPWRHFVALTEGLVNKRKLIGYSWKGGHEIPNSGERGMWVGITQKLVELLEEAQP